MVIADFRAQVQVLSLINSLWLSLDVRVRRKFQMKHESHNLLTKETTDIKPIVDLTFQLLQNGHCHTRRMTWFSMLNLLNRPQTTIYNLHTRIKSPIPNKNKKISVTRGLNYKRASAS